MLPYLLVLLLEPLSVPAAILLEPSGCGDDLVQQATGEEVFLESPNYPSNYPDNLNCNWLISSTTGDAVHIRFETPFHLEVTQIPK